MTRAAKDPKLSIPIVRADGTREWWRRGELHRDGAPAIEWNDGFKMWFVHGELHREGDLPAVERPDGYRAWCLHGRLVREERPRGEGQ